MPLPSEKTGAWVWWVCGLLLLASTINYMDRQTLANTAPRIKAEFHLSSEQYGHLELAFGLAFACGATLFGIVADRTSVRWLYPAVVLAWSAHLNMFQFLTIRRYLVLMFLVLILLLLITAMGI